MGHFMDAPSPQKHWKFYNVTTTNAIKMKLTKIVHLYDTFQEAIDWNVTRRVQEGAIFVEIGLDLGK